MASYKESPEAQHLAAGAKQQGLDVAGSMGLMGSTPAMQAIQSGTGNILASDQQNYLHNLMNQYLSGANIAQGMYGIGANVGQRLGEDVASAQAKEASSGLGGLGSLIGGGLGWLGGLPGVGSAVGKMAGGWLTKHL